MYLFNKMFEANISGTFVAYIGCHQVKCLALMMIFNAETSIFFTIPLTFSQKKKANIFLGPKDISVKQLS